ncbi:MAG: sugar phosphate isomerase/epimerase [Clostridia bacterium]|nr:sugar phosphate isomerase/epimerase [Clostridia bacterium]
MIQKIGVQAYTFRAAYDAENANEETLGAAFRRVKELGYDEIQTAGYGNLTAESYARLAHEAGLAIVGTHIGFEELRNNPEEAMRVHEAVLGTKIMGTGAMPGWARTSREGLFRFIDEANKLGETVGKYGFKFTYHNHHFEFVKGDDNKSIMDHLYERLDPKYCSFCLDTHWVQRGGGNPTTWVEKLAGRIDILHLKDMTVVDLGNPQPLITEIGNGNIDFDSVIAAAEKSGVKYYCVEQDTCPGDPMDSLAISAKYIRERYMK